eukprot:1157257-Pelagomonas_calceolata.AAC.2
MKCGLTGERVVYVGALPATAAVFTALGKLRSTYRHAVLLGYLPSSKISHLAQTQSEGLSLPGLKAFLHLESVILCRLGGPRPLLICHLYSCADSACLKTLGDSATGFLDKDMPGTHLFLWRMDVHGPPSASPWLYTTSWLLNILYHIAELQLAASYFPSSALITGLQCEALAQHMMLCMLSCTCGMPADACVVGWDGIGSHSCTCLRGCM